MRLSNWASALAFVAILGTIPAWTQEINAVTELIQKGKLADARSRLTILLAARKTDGQLWNLLGIVDAQQGNTATATRDFAKAVEFAPLLLPAWLNLGRAWQSQTSDPKSADKAIAAYTSSLKLDPANAEANHQMAVLLEWKGKFRESLDHLNRLPPADRSRRTAVAIRCADEAALGNTSAALDSTRALLADSGLQEDDVLAILPAIESHNPPVAVRLLEGLASRGLATARTTPRLAALYEGTGDLARARESFEKTAQQSGTTVPVLFDLARVAWKQKDYEGVLGYLAHARDLDPSNAAIHFAFGITCNELKVPVEARKSLEKAVALAPGNPYYSYAMGALLLQWSDKTQAIPYLEKFIAARPEDPRGHLALATAYFGGYDQDRAKSELTIPLKHDETRSGAEYLLGLIADQTGDQDAAVAHFRRLTQLEPKSADAHARLAAAFFAKQNLDQARREVHLALALDHDNFVANRTLMNIYQSSGDPRLAEQSHRVKKMIATREESSRLLQRTIEVRPW